MRSRTLRSFQAQLHGSNWENFAPESIHTTRCVLSNFHFILFIFCNTFQNIYTVCETVKFQHTSKLNVFHYYWIYLVIVSSSVLILTNLFILQHLPLTFFHAKLSRGIVSKAPSLSSRGQEVPYSKISSNRISKSGKQILDTGIRPQTSALLLSPCIGPLALKPLQFCSYCDFGRCVHVSSHGFAFSQRI